MKKYLLPLLMIGTMASAQTLISENFEGLSFPPTGWTRANTNAASAWDFNTVIFSPAAVPDFAIAGTKSAGINYTAAPNTADLTSPAFSLVGASSPQLSFKAVVGYSYMIALDAGDLVAQVSTDGSTWTTLWDEDTEFGFMDDGDNNDNTDLYSANIVDVQIPLTAYIGSPNVQIRFLYTATDADGVSIDDVKVVASTLSTNEVGGRSTYTIYPNPSKGEFSVRSADKVVVTRIFDATGKMILANRNSTKVDISNQPSGVYYMNITFADGSVKTEKIIKE